MQDVQSILLSLCVDSRLAIGLDFPDVDAFRYARHVIIGKDDTLQPMGPVIATNLPEYQSSMEIDNFTRSSNLIKKTVSVPTISPNNHYTNSRGIC